MIKVRPKPADLAQLLKSAPEAERAAWATGAAQPSQLVSLLSVAGTRGWIAYS